MTHVTEKRTASASFKRKLLLFSLLFVLIPVVLFFSGLPIPLDSLSPRLESILSHALDRRVTIQGEVHLRPGLRPTLDFGGLQVADPDGWPKNHTFLKVQQAQGQLDLISLLRGSIHITDLEFSGVELRLVTRANHTDNYHFGALKPASPATKKSAPELTGLDVLRLTDIRINYIDEHSGRNFLLIIDEAHGRGIQEEKLHFSLKGTFSGNSCSLEITGDSLYKLLYGDDDTWSLTDGKLQIGDTVLDVSGSLVQTREEASQYLQLAIGGKHLEILSLFFDIPTPDTGPFTLSGQLSVVPGAFRLLGLDINILSSTLRGDLIWSLQGDRPRLAGTIEIPRIHQDLLHLFAAPDNSSSTDSLKTPLPWDLLQAGDMDIHCSLDTLEYNTIQVQKAKAVISLVDGDLIIPFSFLLADIPVRGRLDMGAADRDLALSSSSGDVPLADLWRAFGAKTDLNGTMGALSLQAGSRGNTVVEIKDALKVDAVFGKTTLQIVPGFTVSARDITLLKRPGMPLSLNASGDIRDHPFTVELQAEDLENNFRTSPVPLKLKLHSCDSDLLLDALLMEDMSLDFQLAVTGKNLCGYLSPITDILHRDVHYSAKGSGQLSADAWQLNLNPLRLDTLLMDMQLSKQTSPQQEPFYSAVIHTREMDISPYIPAPSRHDPAPETEEKTVGGDSPGKAPPDKELQQQQLDEANAAIARLLPRKRLFPVDAKVELHVDRLETGMGTAQDLLFSAEITDGNLTSAPFHAVIARQRINGNLKIDLQSDVPTVQLFTKVEDFDLPALYQEFGLHDPPQLQADSVQFDIAFSGRTLDDLMKKSSQHLTVTNGRYFLKRDFGEDLSVTITEADAVNRPGEKSRMTLTGSLNGHPLSLNVEENGLLQVDTLKPITALIDISLGDTSFFFDGTIKRQDKRPSSVSCMFSLSGDRMNSLNQLTNINLPPFGPYSSKGAFTAADGVWRFRDLTVQVGDSSLVGEMTLTGTKNKKQLFDFPIRWDTNLWAEHIQLDDFQTGDWSPATGDNTSSSDTESDSGTKEKKLYNLLDPEIARKFYGSLDLRVDEVLSGTDLLGSGQLNGRLRQGTYFLDTLKLNIPGGEIFMAGSLQPGEQQNKARLSMQVENLDYGILARRTQPDSDLKGKVNVNFSLHSEAPTLLQLREHLNGTFRFGVLPEDYESGGIDLWAVNILTAALPALLKGTPSKVNCLAGRFSLDDGIMQPQTFLLDTSKMRVQAEGEVNFKNNDINFKFTPTAKSPHFFSLATPVTVSGTIFDFDIGVSTEAVFGTVFGLATSVVTVPLRWLLTHKMEADGAAACKEAMNQVLPDTTTSPDSEKKAL